MRYLIFCSLLFLIATPVVRADGATPQQAPEAATSTYKVEPQDVLDITIQDHAELSKTTAVLPDGIISYPYVGEFKASGMTLHEIADRITKALSKEIAMPQVTVTIRTLHERQPSQVSLLGATRATGKFVLKENWHVLDLLIEAGGLPADKGASYSASLLRNGMETIPVDLAHVLPPLTDPKANFLLMPNDVLTVREFIAPPPQVEVLGEVGHPGAVLLPKDGSMVTILNTVGLTPKAALSQAVITHNGQRNTVDLRSYLSEGRIDNVKLESGDELFIPANKQVFRVLGAVGHAGPIPYPDTQKISALDALSLAGGNTPDAILKDAEIVHPFKGGKADITKINMEAVVKKGDLSKDVVLQPGDMLIIPQRGHKSGAFGLSTVLSALSFATLFGL